MQSDSRTLPQGRGGAAVTPSAPRVTFAQDDAKSGDASAAAGAAAAASATPALAPPPAKGLLLRVKRKRHEAPLDQLVVTSSRAEKRAAVDDLREAFHRGAQLSHSGSDTAAAAAADSSNATVPAVPATSPTAPGSLFRAPAQRVFKLLTTISAPKEQHASNDKIQQRIDQMRHTRLLSLPGMLPSAADVHQKHMAAAHVSASERRELLLQQNRARMAALHTAGPSTLPKQQELIVNSDDLLVKIVDVKLPGAGGAAPARTTFEPAPLSQTQSEAAAKAQLKCEQQRREAHAELTASSHRSAASSSLVRGMDAPVSAAAGASHATGADPAQAAAQFTRAMSSIRQMPQIGRAQMDAYKGLLEDYLATLPAQPPKEPEFTPKPLPPEEPRDRVVIPGREANQQDQAQEDVDDEQPRTQSPHLLSRAPNIPIRRKKKQADATEAAAAVDPAAAASESAAAPAPLTAAIGVAGASTPASSPHSALPTAGGIPYDPSQLITTTGTSLHGARGPLQPQQASVHEAAAAMHDATGLMTTGDEDSEYVYDVYHIPEEEAAQQAAVAAIGGASEETHTHKHVHGSDTAVPLAMVLRPDDERVFAGDEYKARYDGASSAYVVLRDGILEWVGNDLDLVHEDELAAEDDGDVDDDEEGEMSDYPEDEDSSAEDEHEDTIRHAPAYYDDDNRPYANAGGSHDPPMTEHTMHSIMRWKQAQQKPHGFYPEGPDADADEEDDDNVVREVRRAMRAGNPELSSDDESSGGEDEFRRCNSRPVQDDEEYTDTILDEEEMEDEREIGEHGYDDVE